MNKWELRRAALAGAMLVAAAGWGGCASDHHDEDPAWCKAVKPGTITSVNKMCAVMTEDPVDPAVEPVMWKGQKVGFCCDHCKPTWKKMSESEKDAGLAKAMATPVPQQ